MLRAPRALGGSFQKRILGVLWGAGEPRTASRGGVSTPPSRSVKGERGEHVGEAGLRFSLEAFPRKGGFPNISPPRATRVGVISELDLPPRDRAATDVNHENNVFLESEWTPTPPPADTQRDRAFLTTEGGPG